MTYQNILETKDERLIEFVDKLITVHNFFRNKEITYKLYDHVFKRKEFNNSEKVILSVFITGIYTILEIRDLLELEEITLDKICKYLKLPKKTLMMEQVNHKEKETYFNEYLSESFKMFTQNVSNILPENYFYICYKTDLIENIIKKISKRYLSYSLISLDILDIVTAKQIKELGKSFNDTSSKVEHFKKITSNNYNKKENVSSKDNNKTKDYGIKLTEAKYTTNPAVGRDSEINEIMACLLMDNSVVLTGEPAVGKTAIVEGLAYKIKNGEVPTNLQNTKILKVNISSLMNGTIYRGQLEKKIEELLMTIENNKDIILFIDELHTIIGTGSNSEQGLDIANMFKPYLDRGQIKIIGATTKEEYKKYIESDSAFKRRFEPVEVIELDNKIIKEILNDVIYKTKKTTNVEFNFSVEEKEKILDIVLELTQKQNRKHNDKINNPDIVIKIIKKAFAYATLEENSELTINNIKTSIINCDKIYDSVKERYIDKLEDISKEQNTTQKSKVIKFKRPIN